MCGYTKMGLKTSISEKGDMNGDIPLALALGEKSGVKCMQYKHEHKYMMLLDFTKVILIQR